MTSGQIKQWTVELQYRVPVFKLVQVEADCAEKACDAAIELDDWEGAEEDIESAGPTFATAIEPGHLDRSNFYNARSTSSVVPQQFREHPKLEALAVWVKERDAGMSATGRPPTGDDYNDLWSQVVAALEGYVEPCAPAS